MKRAIIVGCNGQDGRILFDQLAARGFALVGIAREGTRALAAQCPSHVDILDPGSVESLVREFQPDHVYYLAALHHSAQDRPDIDARKLFEVSHQVHVAGLIAFLQALATHCPQGRLFYAASSHVFGNPKSMPQNEETPLDPVCVYGITKTAGIHTCRFYRQSHSVYASVGILYNHESPHRRPGFVSQKIVRAAIRISQGSQEKLVIGNLSARVDWGWAEDYVLAITRIMDLPLAEDFIIATGQSRSVEEFIQEAFAQVGVDWRKHVEEHPAVLSRCRSGLVGDFSKLNRLTGWHPSLSFSEMVQRLVQSAREQSLPKAR